MNGVTNRDKSIDKEWIELMQEAYKLGLSPKEVKEFLYTQAGFIAKGKK
ncbi:anti-repressor SinI family protein [Priestia aryabhattai]